MAPAAAGCQSERKGGKVEQENKLGRVNLQSFESTGGGERDEGRRKLKVKYTEKYINRVA